MKEEFGKQFGKRLQKTLNVCSFLFYAIGSVLNHQVLEEQLQGQCGGIIEGQGDWEQGDWFINFQNGLEKRCKLLMLSIFGPQLSHFSPTHIFSISVGSLT